MDKLKNFLECGYINKHSKKAVVLVIFSFKDIYITKSFLYSKNIKFQVLNLQILKIFVK